MDEIKKRIQGTLIGCAYGDAMGMPTECLTRDDIKELFPYGIDKFYATTSRDLAGRNMMAGEVTDDTINTVLIAQAIIDNKGVISVESYLNYLQQWIRELPEKSTLVAGPSTKRALAAIEEGTPIEKAGIMGTTNGAAMKISPIGILYDYYDMETLVEKVEQICMPTHNTNIAIAGASAIAACVSYGVRGGNNIHHLWELALSAAAIGKQKGFPIPGVSLERRIHAVRELVDTQPYDVIIDELQNLYGTGVETIETVPAVLAIIQLAKGDPLTTARISAGIGADTDTIGAISTAICGSMHPEFPAEDIALLERVNQLNFADLADGILPYVQIKNV